MEFLKATGAYLALILLLITPAGCTSISGRSGPDVAPVLTIDRPCPPELTAAVPDEPLPPEGVDANLIMAALIAQFGPDKGLEIWQWLMAEENPYSREVIARLKAAHAKCTAK